MHHKGTTRVAIVGPKPSECKQAKGEMPVAAQMLP